MGRGQVPRPSSSFGALGAVDGASFRAVAGSVPAFDPVSDRCGFRPVGRSPLSMPSPARDLAVKGRPAGRPRSLAILVGRYAARS